MDRRDDIRNDRGTAAQTGAADLAVLGAVPAAFAPVPAIADTGALKAQIHAAPTGSRSGDGDDVTSHGGIHAAQAPTDVHDISQPAQAGFVPGAAPILTPGATVGHVTAPAYVPPGSSAIATFVPAPHGAGTVAMPVQGPDAVTGEHAGVAPIASDAVHAPLSMPAPVAIEAVKASIAELHDAIAALSDRLPSVADADQAITPVAEGVDQILGSALQTVSALGHHVAGLADGASEQGIALVTSAGALASPILSAAGHTADTVLGGTAGLFDHATETLANAAGGLTQVPGDTAISALDHFAGTDPGGGIGTLVGMVTAADAFNLHDGAPVADFALAPALGSLGAADLLADIVPGDSLLGIQDHHGGLLDAGHHYGLFGHG